MVRSILKEAARVHEPFRPHPGGAREEKQIHLLQQRWDSLHWPRSSTHPHNARDDGKGLPCPAWAIQTPCSQEPDIDSPASCPARQLHARTAVDRDWLGLREGPASRQSPTGAELVVEQHEALEDTSLAE